MRKAAIKVLLCLFRLSEVEKFGIFQEPFKIKFTSYKLQMEGYKIAKGVFERKV